MKRLGLELVDVVRVDSHGGSLRLVAQKLNGPYSVSKSVEELQEQERALGLYDANTFCQFSDKINRIKGELQDLLASLKKDGKVIAGFGAPAKATTLMYHFDIGPDVIDYIIDDNALKQGLYSPGLHIPILSRKVLEENPPDYLVILAWNFSDAIIRNNKSFLESGGKFIVPLPKVEVIS